MGERKRPKFPARFFPTRAGGRIVESWRELQRQANDVGTGWLEDAEGQGWTVNATYTTERTKRRGS